MTTSRLQRRRGGPARSCRSGRRRRVCCSNSRLVERGLRVRQARGVVVVRADREDAAPARPSARRYQEDDEDDDGDLDRRRAAASPGAALERPSMALAPREAGLHLRPHDSIGGVNERTTPPGRVETTRRSSAVTDAPAATRTSAGSSRSSSGAASCTTTTPGLPARLATGRPIAGYIGFDPSGDVAPRRPPRADLRAAPAAAPRRPPGGPGRRRDRDDRRPVGPLDASGTCSTARRSSATSRRSAASSSGSSTSRRGRRRDHGQQPRLARRAVADRLPARHRQALHGAVHAGQGLRPGPARARACRSPSSATCSCRRTTSPTCTGRWASSCRWAAPTSGATSPPASS